LEIYPLEYINFPNLNIKSNIAIFPNHINSFWYHVNLFTSCISVLVIYTGFSIVSFFSIVSVLDLYIYLYLNLYWYIVSFASFIKILSDDITVSVCN
jgi:hypothetical protein